MYIFLFLLLYQIKKYVNYKVKKLMFKYKCE